MGISMANKLSTSQKDLAAAQNNYTLSQQQLHSTEKIVQNMNHYKDNMEKMMQACDDMDREISSKARIHKHELNEIRDAHQSDIIQMRQKYKTKLDSVDTNYQEQIDHLSRKYGSEVRSLQKELSRVLEQKNTLQKEKHDLESVIRTQVDDTIRLLEIQKRKLQQSKTSSSP